MKILTVCRAGLVRSVALADVLKLHYVPSDVLPMGVDFNSIETKAMLYEWADKIIVMEEHYRDKIPAQYHNKLFVCEVGPDIYGSSKNPQLIDIVWRWVRENTAQLEIEEHNYVV